MNETELRLAYKADDEWVGQIEAVVRSGEFSGIGSAWFDRTNVRETFVAALREYPLTAAAPPTMEGGFWNKDNSGTLEQCHLRIVVRPYRSRGHLMVHVDLSTPIWNCADQDRHHAVTTRFLTSYPEITRFGAELDEVLEGTREHAVLAAVDF